MIIERVVLENFRNFESLNLSINQGFVVLVGANGAGKTNFLEGIYFGSSLRRFPESQLQQLLKQGKQFFRIKIENRGPEEQRQEVYCENENGKITYRLQIDKQQAARSKYAGVAPVVSFLPQDLTLLTRSPNNRRRFLNESLSNVFADYRNALSNYEKVLEHRNELLQKIGNKAPAPDELSIWDEQLAEHGSLITDRREKFEEFVNQDLGRVLQAIFPELGEVKLHYQKSGGASVDEFLKKLAAAQSKERELLTTAVGPHRDDFWLGAKGEPLVGFVSRGQMRSLVLGLKTLQKAYIEKARGDSPIMLLDDVFSEFDQPHQQRLIDFLKSFGQVFMSTVHLEEILNYLPERTQIIKIKDGQIVS